MRVAAAPHLALFHRRTTFVQVLDVDEYTIKEYPVGQWKSEIVRIGRWCHFGVPRLESSQDPLRESEKVGEVSMASKASQTTSRQSRMRFDSGCAPLNTCGMDQKPPEVFVPSQQAD